MTTAADDSTVEDAFEALLAGRSAPVEAAGLAAFTEAVRATATPPGRPSAALAELLATGLLVDQSSPSARTARSAGATPSRGPGVRNRRRFAMFFPALLAKIVSGSALVQASAGAGVVLVAFTGVGAAGALPGGVQDGFATVVATVTPFEAPISEQAGPLADEPVVGAPVDQALVEESPVEEAEEGEAPLVEEEVWPSERQWATTGPVDGHPFGTWVSYGREQGWGDGALVSCWAHARNDERKNGDVTECGPAAAPAEDGSEGGDAPEVRSPAVELPEQDTADSGDSGSSAGGDRGNGNGGGHGGGHGGGNGGGNGNGRN